MLGTVSTLCDGLRQLHHAGCGLLQKRSLFIRTVSGDLDDAMLSFALSMLLISFGSVKAGYTQCYRSYFYENCR
ncbi:UNVERIFIED_ORG: hypothetical protein ABIC62_006697 [Burkholderia sp. 1595]|uniref:Uncharacterized protein n=1 Tax=Paraburkholderia terricola TaxID=169427 RepID=A0ABU1M2L0_9BURK|nr:hypothetical protein [Paraburkholderia terricola]